MAAGIRDELVEKRRRRLAALGHDEGAVLPDRRDAPLTPFLGGNGLICEIKRRSPSRGDIAAGLDAVEQAGRYARAGAGNLSVLTEPEGFGGCLDDLRRVKQAFPDMAALRKDFLFDLEDVDASWRAGADAVLLIAGMLAAERLALLYSRARQLGMAALVELHDRDDLAKAAGLKPAFTGINSRDLASFRLDPLLPLEIAAGVDWPTTLVFESGIAHPEQAVFARACGFGGILVGEAAVRRPELAGRLLEALRESRRDRFWPGIGRRLFSKSGGRPLVKICGLTGEEDARLAAAAGADVLGFVFWSESPRRADPELLKRLGDLDVPKVGVLVNAAGARDIRPEARELLEGGWLDAVQFHGAEEPDDCARLWPSYYKAVKPGGKDDVREAENFRSPRLLLDASAGGLPGGTGERVADGILEAWNRPLWLAGGVRPENAADIMGKWRPELIDVASGVEERPGKKSPGRLRRLFEAIARAGEENP